MAITKVSDMNIIIKDGKAYVDSREVASIIGTRHDNFLRNIITGCKLNKLFLAGDHVEHEEINRYVRRYSVLSMHGIQAIREVSVPEKAKQLNKIAISMAKVEKYALKKAAPLPVEQKAVPVVVTDLVPTASSKVSSEFADLTDDLVEVQDGQTLVNSRQVAYRFERRHDNVLQNVEELLNRSPEISGHLFHENSYTSLQGKLIKQYLMNRKGFFMLVSSFKSAAADEWKSRFYDAFESMENQLAKKDRTPRTYVEALRSLLETAERNEVLEAENVQIRQLNSELIPKAEVYDLIANSGRVYTVRAVSKRINFIGMGERILYQFLRDEGIVTKDNNFYQPYAKYCSLKETSFKDKNNGKEHINTVLYFNVDGINLILQRLLKAGYKAHDAESLKEYPAMKKYLDREQKLNKKPKQPKQQKQQKKPVPNFSGIVLKAPVQTKLFTSDRQAN